METRYEQTVRLYKEALAATRASNAASKNAPMYGSADWREWQALLTKSIEANDAYLDFIKENPPAPAWK